MNDELSRKIIQTFPNTYSNTDPAEPFNYDSAGFQCDDGWFNIIYDLSSLIEKELLTMNIRERAKYSVVQVKEKFGSLRFYMSAMTDNMREAISIAEAFSEHTCEKCGAAGSLRGGRWMITLCDNCIEVKNEK